MTDAYVLDTNIISKICTPRHPENKEISKWFLNFIRKGHKIYLAEIVLYELKRWLSYEKLKDPQHKGLERLNNFSQHLTFLPMSTAAFDLAAQLWAESRANGYPSAGKEALDADVILAAQAKLNNSEVVTENLKHLKNFVLAHHWKDL